MLTPETLPVIQRRLAEMGLDGWLIYDFQGTNPAARPILGLDGFISRRIFALIPREGVPHGLGHAIEPGPWGKWPAEWTRGSYSSWRSLEDSVGAMVTGRRLAMEYSAGDAVPYLDRVPAGVLEMIRSAGAVDIVSSGELVSEFYAAWTPAHMASHRRTAEIIRDIAREAFALIGRRARTDAPATELEVMQWILGEFHANGLETDHGPNVSASANAANPHYEPSEANPRPIVEGDTVLIDLWAHPDDGVWADQTWMASVGEPSARALEVWTAIRDAREAAVECVVSGVAAGKALSGGEVDDAARRVVESRGFGEYFTHRTGHSIDPRSLHGAGPHLDNLETREERLLISGVAFSIEPGIYIPGEIGMRTEVNAYIEGGRAVITPDVRQTDLIIV